MEQEQWQQGIQDYTLALEMLRPAGDSRTLAEAEYDLALVLEFNGELKEAMERVLEAERIITVLNQPIGSGKGKERVTDDVAEGGEFTEILQDFKVKKAELEEKIREPLIGGVEDVVDAMGRIVNRGGKRDAPCDVSGLVRKKVKVDEVKSADYVSAVEEVKVVEAVKSVEETKEVEVAKSVEETKEVVVEEVKPVVA
jgi:hypothetical protein